MTKPTTRVYRALILEALKQGDATTRELVDRIGGEPPGGMSALSQWLRTLERQGHLREAQRSHARSKANRPAIIWALSEPKTEEAAA